MPRTPSMSQLGRPMSVDRVISEYQSTIDRLHAQIKILERDVEVVYTQHDELFEVMSRLINFRVKENWDKDKDQSFIDYTNIRREALRRLKEAGYCVACGFFYCECGE